MKPIIWKGIAEHWKTVPVPFIIGLIAAYIFAPKPDYDNFLPVIVGVVYNVTFLLGGVYALALAILQTWREQRSDARGWLFTQPAFRTELYWGKLLAALALYLAAFLPVYAICMLLLRANFPYYGAIDPRSMRVALIALAAAFTFYPAGVWMMTRQANWIGSRVFPLWFGFAIFGTIPAISAAFTYRSRQSGAVESLWLLLAVIFLMFLISTPYIASSYSYRVLTNSPTRWRTQGRTNTDSRGGLQCWFAMAGVLLATFGTYMFAYTWAGVFVLGAIASTKQAPNPIKSEYLVDSTGDFFLIRTEPESNSRSTKGSANSSSSESPERRFNGSVVKDIVRFLERSEEGSQDGKSSGGRTTIPEEKWTRLKDESRTQAKVTIQSERLHYYTRFEPFTYFQRSNIYYPAGFRIVQDRKGTLWIYQQDPHPSKQVRLVDKMNRKGFGRTDSSFTPWDVQRLHDLNHLIGGPRDPWGDNPKLAFDREGIYQIDFRNRQITTLLEVGIESATWVVRHGEKKGTLVICSGREIRLYQATIPEKMAMELNYQGRFLLPEDWGTFGASEEFIADINGKLRLLKKNSLRAMLVELPSSAPTGETLAVKYYDDISSGDQYDYNATPTVEGFLAGNMPPWITLLYSSFIDMSTRDAGPRMTWVAIGLALQGIGSFILTNWMASRRGLRRRDRWIWLGVTLLCGWCTPIMLAAFHFRVAKAPCSNCGNNMRVDEAECPHCGGRTLAIPNRKPKPEGITVSPLPCVP